VLCVFRVELFVRVKCLSKVIWVCEEVVVGGRDAIELKCASL
jgi:hypothetical protein